MSQDTRKDPRAKVLTMTVRYKSATLDEFIEHHSYDVSRGGMFIKTPSPFPPGTLLKFEVKIAADQKVIQGVGRVVWKRDGESTADVRPAGMGVKFIKIDDASRKVIESLIESRGDASSAYDAGGGDGGGAPEPLAASAAKAPGAELPKAPNLRKATMIGLGAMAPASRTPVSSPDEKPQASFFPETSPADMPAPEDRTMMKQAAELLQDALREAGGSMAELDSPAKSADSPPKSAGRSSAPESTASAEPPSVKPSSVKPSSVKSPSSKPEPSLSPSAAAMSERAAVAKSERAAPAKAAAVPVAARKTVSAAPASRRVPLPVAAAPAASGGGGGRVVVIALVIAATAGLVYALSSTNPPAPAPEASAEPAVAPAPSAAPVVADTPPVAPVESAAPVETAAPIGSAAAVPTQPTAVVPAVPTPPVVPKAAPVARDNCTEAAAEPSEAGPAALCTVT